MSDAPHWRRYLRFWGSDPAADLDDELAARLEAERRFGAMPPVREACRTIDQRRARRGARTDGMHALFKDVRYALGTIRMSPGFSAVVVLTLALGIGATTTMFSVVDRVLLRSLPDPASEQLVALAASGSDAASGTDFEFSYPDYVDWKERSHGLFSNIVAWQSTNFVVSGGGVPEVLWASLHGARASAN
jgi:hypothetical protein